MIKWVHKSNSFKKAKAFEKKLNKTLPLEKRLSDLQICREQYFKLKGLNENRKRLRRVFKITKQTQS